jgi:Ni,Fe-hydrogenase I cytochrome b subunit
MRSSAANPRLRIVHILSMWFFIIFVLIHVYMSIMITLVNKDKTLTSIITGYKLQKHSK